MKGIKRRIILPILLSLALAQGPQSNSGEVNSDYNKAKFEKTYEEIKKREKHEDFLEAVKKYNLPRLKTYRGVVSEDCSKYARRIGRDVHKKNYSWTHSWNRIYTDSIVSKVGEHNDLEKMAEEGTLKPGMLVGFDYLGSDERNKKDMEGNKRQITHVVVYQGAEINQDSTGFNLVFDQNWGPRQERIRTGSKWYQKMKDSLIPKYVFDAKKN